MTNNFDINM